MSRADDDDARESGFGVHGEHHARAATVRSNHGLHTGRQGDADLIDAVLFQGFIDRGHLFLQQVAQREPQLVERMVRALAERSYPSPLVDPSWTNAELGITLTSVHDGLEETVRWLRDNAKI